MRPAARTIEGVAFTRSPRGVWEADLGGAKMAVYDKRLAGGGARHGSGWWSAGASLDGRQVAHDGGAYTFAGAAAWLVKTVRAHVDKFGAKEGWQPIATAPRDGTPVLACGPYGGRGDLALHPRAVRWEEYHPNAPGKTCWRNAQGHREPHLTHWRLMFEAPAAEPQGGSSDSRAAGGPEPPDGAVNAGQ